MRSKSRKAANKFAQEEEAGSPRVAEPIKALHLADATQDNAYDVILEVLHRKRDEIEAAIAAVMLVATSSSKEPPINISTPAYPRARGIRQPISEAILAVLRELGGPVRNSDIQIALSKRGFKFSGNASVSIAQCLVRLASAKLVVKVGRGVWKLTPASERMRR